MDQQRDDDIETSMPPKKKRKRGNPPNRTPPILPPPVETLEAEDISSDIGGGQIESSNTSDVEGTIADDQYARVQTKAHIRDY